MGGVLATPVIPTINPFIHPSSPPPGDGEVEKVIERERGIVCPPGGRHAGTRAEPAPDDPGVTGSRLLSLVRVGHGFDTNHTTTCPFD